MEILGLELVSNHQKSNKPKIALPGEGESFLGHLGKNFKTFEDRGVHETYMADRSWWKKNVLQVQFLNLDEEEDESLAVLYKEYRKILLKMYRLKQELKES